MPVSVITFLVFSKFFLGRFIAARVCILGIFKSFFVFLLMALAPFRGAFFCSMILDGSMPTLVRLESKCRLSVNVNLVV